MDKKYIVAVELSGSQVKGVAVSMPQQSYTPLTVPTVETLIAEDAKNCVQYGRVQNLLDAEHAVSYLLQKLENSPALRDGQITAVYVALAGRSLGSVKVSADLALPSEMEITDDILKRLQQEATKTVSPEKKVLSVVPRKYVIDNLAHTKPVGALGNKIHGDFTLVTCNHLNRRNLEMVVKDRLKLNIKDFIVTPLALADMLLPEEDKQVGCMLVDIGQNTTTVAIYKDRALQYLATLPLGSYNITHDIAMGMNITDERAEAAKLNQGDALYETRGNDETSRINCYVKARIGEILANILVQVEYAGYKQSDLPAGLVLTGRGSRLTNLQQLVTEQSKLKVRTVNNVEAFNYNNTDFSPRDYASILAVALSAAKSSDTQSCIEFPEPKVEEAPQPKPVENQNGGYVMTNDKDEDESWQHDDDEEDTKRKPARKSEHRPKRNSNLFSNIGKQLKNLLNSDSDADDADLDENLDN